MSFPRSRDFMWSDAVELIDRMERLHRRDFAPNRPSGRGPIWEPPVDMLETDQGVLVLISLPGVDPDHVDAVIEDGVLVVSGHRILPPELRTAKIHRLELPQGRFERRLPLPAGRYDAVRRSVVHGCLLITLHKAGGR
jgi:HSP20 family protein